MGKTFEGMNNPFWGRSHSDETRAKISKGRKGHTLGNQHARGYKHTEAARQKIVAASKRLWAEHREKMLKNRPRGPANHMYKLPELRVYRQDWTPVQRREWIEPQCRWCGSIEHLILDHIIPLCLDGGRYRENAQTLCQPCNLWKLYNVDLPMWKSSQAKHGAPKNPL